MKNEGRVRKEEKGGMMKDNKERRYEKGERRKIEGRRRTVKRIKR